MRILEGDIFDYMNQGCFDIVIHGCNCFNTMGAGIAAQFKTKYPSVCNIDLQSTKGDKNKLGKFTESQITTQANNHKVIVLNAYTQFHYGSGLKADYQAIRNVFNLISKRFSKENRIGYPQIGAGLAGGDWKLISQIINEELKGFDHTVVIYK